MIEVRDFPLKCLLLRKYVKALYVASSTFAENGNEDLFVQLKDGREFGFTVFALANVQQLMQQDDINAFVSPGMLIVTSVTWDSIFFAIEECLRLSVDNNFSFEHFGVLQKGAI